MKFGWINLINAIAVAYLVLLNLFFSLKGKQEGFKSKYFAVELLEQIGRYGSMLFMILPVWTNGWEFGFRTVPSMFVWLIATFGTLIAYTVLWFIGKKGKNGRLYALSILPVALFLLNGILLRHIVLIVFAAVFGVFHVWIVRENLKKGEKNA